MPSFISVSIQLLNYSRLVALRFFLGFAIKPALFSSSSLSIANLSSNSLRVSSVCIATMLNCSLLVEIRRQESYVDSSIDSFSL